MTSQSLNGASLEALLDSYLELGVPKAGELRDGYVVAVRNNEVLIDIGAKSEGVIPTEEYDLLSKRQRDELQVGKEIRICVVNPEDERVGILVSYLKVAEEDDWRTAKALQESGDVIECPVIGFNRGGLLAQLGALRGFVPASQLGFDNQVDRGGEMDEQLRPLVGNTILVKVLEANQNKGRLILSEMAADKERRARSRDKRMAELEVGQVYEGRVINITDFGAFIDIGEIEGLVHTSELSWKHVSKPSQVLTVGQAVQVMVIALDPDRQRITLSMKQLEHDPWAQIGNIYKEGQLVEVTITQLTRYGAFARINDEYRLEGLIHISELAEAHVKTPDEVVRKGQKTAARIIRMDAENRQIGFSIKQVYSDKFMELDLALNAGSQ